MGLEAPNYLNDLVETNPVGATDFRSEGDDHIRGLKKAVKQTFPGMAGRAWRKRAVSASDSITIQDNFVLIKAASGITLTPSAAATLGNGFMCMVRADSGNVTVDPVENINGVASLTVPNGYTAVIFCDGTEFFAYLVHHAVPAVTPAFPAGTTMLFHQTAAPTGWTKLGNTQYNNATLRMTTGVVATGGLDEFTTVFGTSKVTGGTVLTEAQLASHSHPYLDSTVTGSGGSALGSGNNIVDVGRTTSATGGNAAHTHPLTMNIKYVDVIVATKD